MTLKLQGSSFRSEFVRCFKCQRKFVWLNAYDRGDGTFTPYCAKCRKEYEDMKLWMNMIIRQSNNLRKMILKNSKKNLRGVRTTFNSHRIALGGKMGIYKSSTWELAKAIDNALDGCEDFTEEQLFDALERAKLYPFVMDKKKSVPKYIKAGLILQGIKEAKK